MWFGWQQTFRVLSVTRCCIGEISDYFCTTSMARSKHVTADDLCELVIAQIHFMWPKQKNICNLAHMRWTCGWFEAAGHKPNQSVSRGQIQSGQTDNHRCVGNVQQMLPCDQDISTLNKLLINLCQTFMTTVCINLVCYTVSLWVTAIPIKMFITTSRWIALNQCKIYTVRCCGGHIIFIYSSIF